MKASSEVAPVLPADEPAWVSPRAWLRLTIFTLLGLLADLLSKWLAFQHIAGVPVVVDRARVLASARPGDTIPVHAPVVVIPDVLNFTLVLNPGAVFGMGAGKRWFFIAFTFVAVSAAIWVFATWTVARSRLAHAAVGLLMSGGLGNLYDRIRYGCVRDFIHPLPGVPLPFGWEWPWGGREVWPYVSNVADLWLILGMVILIFTSGSQLPGAGKKTVNGASSGAGRASGA